MENTQVMRNNLHAQTSIPESKDENMTNGAEQDSSLDVLSQSTQAEGLDKTAEEILSSLLATEAGQAALREEEARLKLKENADDAEKRLVREREAVRSALSQSPPNLLQRLRPIAKLPLVHRVLHSFVILANNKGWPFEAIEDDDDVTESFEAIRTVQDTSPETLSLLNALWCEEAGKDRAKEEEVAASKAENHELMRDEWIPGISKGRRKLTSAELASHLSLAEKMKAEGNTAFYKGAYEEALTRYCQGVNTLNWIEAMNEQDAQLVNELYLAHLKNQSQAALMCDHWNDAIKACIKAAEIDPDDMKVKYRHAYALHMLGRLKEAEIFLKEIVTSPFSDPQSRAAAQHAEATLHKTYIRNKADLTSIIDQSVKKSHFSRERKSDENTRPSCEKLAAMEEEIFKRRYPAIAAAMAARQAAQHHNSPATTSAEGQGKEPSDLLPASQPSRSLSPPSINVPRCIALLDAIKIAYTSEDCEKELRQIRSAADFEEHRVLIRLKKILPTWLDPVLQKFDFEGATFEERKKAMESSVAYWRCKQGEEGETIRQKSKEIMGIIMGDMWDD